MDEIEMNEQSTVPENIVLHSISSNSILKYFFKNQQNQNLTLLQTFLHQKS